MDAKQGRSRRERTSWHPDVLAGGDRYRERARGPRITGRMALPPVDLSVHLHRHPVDDWLGFDTSVVFGPDGLGITSSVVHDSTGPVGRLEQMVTIRRHSHPRRETGMRPDLPHRRSFTSQAIPHVADAGPPSGLMTDQSRI
ncbi:hypothetical protein ABZY09_48395 [Streptomyces sp. NPDC002928]|uniref:hypothetical protein n=1 Tax=Streptomyces sp. NPDC002928 TaxID=3154440 RepID=UPI0033AAFEB5